MQLERFYKKIISVAFVMIASLGIFSSSFSFAEENQLVGPQDSRSDIFTKANTLANQGDHENAIRIYARAINKYPDDSVLRYYLISSYMALKKAERAAIAYISLMYADKKFKPAHINRIEFLPFPTKFKFNSYTEKKEHYDDIYDLFLSDDLHQSTLGMRRILNHGLEESILEPKLRNHMDKMLVSVITFRLAHKPTLEHHEHMFNLRNLNSTGMNAGLEKLAKEGFLPAKQVIEMAKRLQEQNRK